MPGIREDELSVAGLRIEGVAQGGVETNLRVPELKMMFDIGMSPAKAMRFRRVMISHGHTDHFGGIHYFLSQRGMMKMSPAIIHLPEPLVEPLEQLLALWSKIEGFDYAYELHPAKPGDRHKINKNITAIAVASNHRIPSLAWVIERRSQRLLPAYQDMPGAEIAELRKRGEPVTSSHVEPVLGVTGDTTIDAFLNSELLRQCKVLVHECTAFDDRRDVATIRKWGHTHIDELIEHAERFEGEALVLVHRSLRHSRGFAKRVVRERFPASVRDKVFIFGHD